ncbi:MAG: hypothetical protein ACK5Q5_16815, partial [Planctomycetaceae bacterium]
VTDRDRDGQVSAEEFADPAATLAAVAAGKSARAVARQSTNRGPSPTTAAADEDGAGPLGWNWRMILLIGFNALLLGGLAWLFLRPGS